MLTGSLLRPGLLSGVIYNKNRFFFFFWGGGVKKKNTQCFKEEDNVFKRGRGEEVIHGRGYWVIGKLRITNYGFTNSPFPKGNHNFFLIIFFFQTKKKKNHT